MKRRIILFSFVVLFISSCTTYHKMGFTGGYDDFPLGSGKYQIIAKGNGYTNEERVRAIAFKRAAELTLSLGYKYFYIIDNQNQTKSNYVINSNRNGTYINNIEKSSFIMIIEPTVNSDGVEASKYYDVNE